MTDDIPSDRVRKRSDFLSRLALKPGELEQRQAIHDTVCAAFADAAHPILTAKICLPVTEADVKELQAALKKVPLAALPRADRAAFKQKRESVRPDNPVAYQEMEQTNSETAKEYAGESAALLVHYLMTTGEMQSARDAGLQPTSQAIRPGAFTECSAAWNSMHKYVSDRYGLEPREIDTILCNGLRSLSKDGKDVVLAPDVIVPHATVQTALARPYAFG